MDSAPGTPTANRKGSQHVGLLWCKWRMDQPFLLCNCAKLTGVIKVKLSSSRGRGADYRHGCAENGTANLQRIITGARILFD